MPRRRMDPQSQEELLAAQVTDLQRQLAALKEQPKPDLKTELESITVAMPSDLKQQASAEAERRHTSLSALIRYTLAEAVGYDTQSANRHARSGRGKTSPKQRYERDSRLLQLARAALAGSDDDPVASYLREGLGAG